MEIFSLSFQVVFTSLRLVLGGDGRLLAGGWSRKKGAAEADAFVVAEINPSERLVTFKAAKVCCRCCLRARKFHGCLFAEPRVWCLSTDVECALESIGSGLSCLRGDWACCLRDLPCDLVLGCSSPVACFAMANADSWNSQPSNGAQIRTSLSCGAVPGLRLMPYCLPTLV